MIFVTVGTHEQPFNRLVSCVDQLKASGKLGDEEVVIQAGYSTYEPKCCKSSKLIAPAEVTDLVKKARIVITHGGPSSFILPLTYGKIPIVVPRQADFQEHVNNHQLNFCRAVAQQMKNIILVEDIDKLEETIASYDHIVANMNASLNSNNEKFVTRFEEIVDDLMKK